MTARAPVGSYPHAKIVESFAELREALAAKDVQGPAKPKPFTLPVDEGKPLYAVPPTASTSELAKYLEGMAQVVREELDDAVDF